VGGDLYSSLLEGESGLIIMKIKFIILYVFLGLTLYGSIQADVIHGVVRDIDSRALKGVRVILYPSARVSYTDENGVFTIIKPIDLSVNKGVLFFSKAGFFTNSISLQKFFRYSKKVVFLVGAEYLSEEISISALNREETKIDVPLAESSISRLEIQEKLPVNMVEILEDSPGVHFIGQGGLKVTPTIRGMGRKRVLVLLDGARITSDRRAGVSASFIPALFMNRVEVVRSSSSVLYGSDAMGGIINIRTRTADAYRNSLSLTYNINDQRFDAGFVFGKESKGINVFSGFNFTRAGDYKSPDFKIHHSGYQNIAGIFEIALKDRKRGLSFSYFGSAGSDIGKPDRENLLNSFKFYPEEKNHFIRLNYKEKDLIGDNDLNLTIYLNPSKIKLQKVNTVLDKRSTADIQSFNFGLKSWLLGRLNRDLSYQFGVELYGRDNLTIRNIQDDSGGFVVNTPLSRGKRSDLGLFFTVDFSGLKNIDILAGVRYTFFDLSAVEAGKSKSKYDSSASAFVALNKKFSKNLSVFVNLSKAFRVPSLTELFYTGLSGRKAVIGNDQLCSENSINIDGGLKLYFNKIFVGFYGFSYQINDMIERYLLEDGNYTYGNINQGRIQGIEWECQLFPWENFELFVHGSLYRGRSRDADIPLNDVLSPRVMLGIKHIYKKFWFEGNVLYSGKKNYPGPAEVSNRSYLLLNLKAGCYMSSRVFLFLRFRNLLNSSYYANQDPDIPLSPGFSMISGIQINI
jgi:outer membrane receptor protein involved in Fe transport